MKPPQLTVVGLDAATYDVIDPMITAGELPHLAALFSEGSRGVLRSTTHPLTTQAWTTMLTGVNAGHHGMWDFSERDATGYRLRVVNGSYRRAPAVWDFLTAAQRQVGVMNVPFTWPASQVNGFFMAGLDAAARERGLAHPDNLVADLKRRYGKLIFDHGLPLDRNGYIDADEMCKTIEQRVDMALWLMERFEPELLLVVFMAADHMQHYGWNEWESDGLSSRVAKIYRRLDDAVGAFVEAAGPQGDVMVVSDHGAGQMKGVINLNAWLAENGWLTYASTRGMIGGELPRLTLYRLLELRRRLPKGLRDFAKQRAPMLRDRVHELKEFTAVDFQRTRAFAYGNMGNIVINLRGREKFGIVEKGDEYDRLCEDIRAQALELRHPETGEQLIVAVHRRDELFEGPELERIPDLIVEFDHYAWAGKGNLMKATPMFEDIIKMPDSGHEHYVGTHRHEGIIGFRGQSAQEAKIAPANIQDVAPTIMYLLGEKVPIQMEGRVLEEMLDPTLLSDRSIDYADADGVVVGIREAENYSPDELDEVESRLRNLGYLE